jgi:outer membrane protein assembly factor BamB
LGSSAWALTPPSISWAGTFGSPGGDLGYAVDRTIDGGFILAGETTVNDVPDVYLVRVDAAGQMLWERNLGGAAIDRCRSVKQTADGGFILCGETGVPFINYDVLLMKTDAQGRLLWQRTFGGSGKDLGRAVLALQDGYVLCGDRDANEFYVVRTDIHGQALWERSFGGGDDHAYAVRQTAGGDFLVCGYRGDGSIAPEFDARLLKISASGQLLWARNFGQSIDDRAFDLQVLPGGGIAVAGLGGGDYTLWRFGATGQLQRTTSYGTVTTDQAFALERTVDEGFLLAGYTWAYEDGYQIYTVRTDAQGQLLYESFLGGPGWELAYGAVPTGDGGFVLVGSIDSEGVGSYDLYAVRLDSDGAPTAVEAVGRPQPLSLDAYPNPFNPRVTIDFVADQPGPARVDVFDVRGRRVFTLLDESVPAGERVLIWEGRDTRGAELPSGTYLVRAVTASGSAARKVSLLR